MATNSVNLLERCASQILNGVDEDDDAFPLSKVAISVFDRWLGEKNLHLLDCKDIAEREDRNRRMLSFWMEIYDKCEILCRGDNDEFRLEPNRIAYESSCAYDGDRPGSEFQCILIPEFTAIYYENWDDTNVLWYSRRDDVQPLISMALNCGLHPIEFA